MDYSYKCGFSERAFTLTQPSVYLASNHPLGGVRAIAAGNNGLLDTLYTDSIFGNASFNIIDQTMVRFWFSKATHTPYDTIVNFTPSDSLVSLSITLPAL